MMARFLLALLKTDASVGDEDVASIRSSPPVRTAGILVRLVTG
jgi:hypothetical protein